MTTIRSKWVACGNCKNASCHNVMYSTNSFGSPDLDLRPAPTMRDTMSMWLQQCPSCGYVAPDLSEEAGNLSRVLASAQYSATLNDERIPNLARRFECRALIEQFRRNTIGAAERHLQAAWIADDENNTQEAIGFRRKSAADFQTYLRRELSDRGAPTNVPTRLVDILRRSEQWADADALCAHLINISDKPTLTAILEFQSECIGRQDSGRYSVEDALPWRSPAAAGLLDPKPGLTFAAARREMIDAWRELVDCRDFSIGRRVLLYALVALMLPVVPIWIAGISLATLAGGRVPITMKPWCRWPENHLSPEE